MEHPVSYGLDMKLTSSEIARMIDLSAVKAEDTEEYIKALVVTAIKYQCVAVYPLPSHILLTRELLQGQTNILLGGAVGFPSGGTSTASKVFETREQIEQGCQEIDMVINIGKLLSGRYQEVLSDLRAVSEACGTIPLKVILECHYLDETQIRKACDLCREAKANWVKTGTGWAPTGATLENITIIKSQVGETTGVKAAGGVRDLTTVIEMYKRGARRFGVGLVSSKKILEQAFSLPNGVIEF